MSGATGDRHITELLTPYYLDMLDRVEGPLVTAHLDDCPDCRGAADAVIETIAVLALLPEGDREELLDNFGALNRTGPPPARFVEFLAHEPEPEPAPGLRRRLRDLAGPASSKAAQVAAPAAPSAVLDTAAPSAVPDTTAPAPIVSRPAASAPTPAAPAPAAAAPPPPPAVAVPPPPPAPAVQSTSPAVPAPASVPQVPARTAVVSRVAPPPVAGVPAVPGSTPRSSEPLASEPIVPIAEHPGPTRPVGRKERGPATAGPLRTPGQPQAVAVAATSTGVRGDRRRPGGEAHADRRTVPTRRRRGAMVRAGLLLTTALAVAGLAIGALVQHVDRVAPPLAVTVTAVAADSATGASLSVVATGQGDGVDVRAAVDGLKTGAGYRLMAATSDGRVWRVLSWEADDTTQNVGGHLAVPLATVASFSVARAGGGAIVTADVPPRR
ncbi:hypothetical protein [Micromonospora sp. NPDC005979]|uniref:hypothetical protein n=1 Tax=Micromonospora sp. NPDC005979 TaxID=3156726 RepID=UPI0033BAB1C4